MDNSQAFSPNWLSPPGETISCILATREINEKEFYRQIGICSNEGKRLLVGEIPITEEIAINLESFLEVPAYYWLEKEFFFQSKKHIEKDRIVEWLERLPITDMVKNSWIPKGLKTFQKHSACLDFFGVESVDEWEKKYNRNLEMVAFKTSKTFDIKSESVIVWLRQAELQALETECESWNKSRLLESLSEIKKLSRIKSPLDFLPILRVILERCGVALSIVKSPNGCRASGATFFPTPELAVLVLSMRFLSDDHFWFTLFHEIGHLVLHSTENLFLEFNSSIHSKEEADADKFAEETLIPLEYRAIIQSYTAKDWKKIIRLAKKLDISPGIIVGQMQHKEIISFAYLNKLKTRYKWG
jgi:HTH-type transcriptional regulator/antitoxin HigA